MKLPFASRVFKTGNEEIICSFYMPTVDGSDFKCEYHIRSGEKVEKSYACGVDEVQALILAMQKAHVDLLASDRYQICGLNWLGLRDLHLPLPPGVKVDDFRDLPPEGS